MDNFLISLFQPLKYAKLFFPVFMLLGTIASVAQNEFRGNHELYIDLEYDVTESYSHEFTIEERTLWYGDDSFKINIRQVDLSHFSRMELDEKNAFAFGIQYRFEENFVSDEENELRFTEEYAYTTQPNAIEFEHRLRAEQRIAGSSASHRFRYSFEVTRSLKGPEIDTGEAYIIGDLETLLTIANTSKPEFEQRIGAGVGLVLSDFMKLELVTEYRLADFTQNLEHEFFLVTGMKFTL